ncbi:NAD(P)-binding protein [Meredithblackwellia eburnea MCA 4105]
MAPVGVALLGAGNFAKGAHLPAVAAASETILLKAVYSRSKDSAESLLEATKAFASTSSSQVDLYFDSPSDSANGGLDALLTRKDVQAVILSLPILIQPDVIKKAWDAGKHVISEKPVGKDVDVARTLIRLYEEKYKPKGIQWIIAEQFPYEEVFTIAKEIVSSGKIGQVQSFTLDYNNFIAPGNKSHETAWRKTPQFQGGFLLDGGVHFIAALRHILPSPIANVSAVTSQIQPHLAPSDLLHGIATTASGVQGSLRISWGIPSSTKRLIIIYGSEGRVEADYSPFEDGNFVARTYLSADPDTPSYEVKAKAQGVVSEFAFFGKALLAGPGSKEAELVQERSGPRATLRDVAVIEGALTSQGQPKDVIGPLEDLV